MTATPLVELCVEKVSRDLAWFNPDDLASLPRHLAEEVVKRVFERQWPPPLLHELLILCQAFWKPSSLSLHRHLLSLDSGSLSYLSYVPSIVKLDLSCNAWLDSLEFLPELVHLQCLNLRDCWRLPEQTLGYIGGLTRLSCLDMQNVYSLTDSSASTFLTGITALQCLNLSGTGVSDGLLEVLSYGQRLRAWLAKENVSKRAEGSAAFSVESKHDLLQQWKPLELVYLRLQHTKITEAAVPLISAFEQLLFVDVRDTEIPGRSLKSLQAKHKFISLPNNAKVLARWNSLIVAAFQGYCGCSSLELSAPTAQHSSKEEQPDWLAQWEQRGVTRLLLAANRQTSSRSRIHP